MTVQVFQKGKASHDNRLHLLNLPRNWLHQGYSYMDWGEFISRILIELVEIGILYVLLSLVVGQGVVSDWTIGVGSALLVHTFNWVTNGNIWALLLFAFPHMNNKGDEETCAYLNEMGVRLGRSTSIMGLALFGSSSRGQWHEKSDVDIRIIRAPGLLNLLYSILLTMRERWLGMVAGQPVDIFLADGVPFLHKLRSDEKPLFLVKRGTALEKAYPSNSPVQLTTLRRPISET